MKDRRITEERRLAFEGRLREEERSRATVEKYCREVVAFSRWLGREAVTKEAVLRWKDALLARGLRPATVNGKLTALSRFFCFTGWEDCRVRQLRLQRRIFCGREKELSREEYERLVRTAREKGQKGLALLLEAICSTGIRVSEVRFLTVEAAKRGRAEISLKGKSRVILLPEKLCKRLLSYAAKRGIRRGEVFLSKTGRSLDRRRIWREMKALCPLAGVRAEKVFPHNLRHLFARVFYEITRDISKLSDVLGHSSMETTRVYLISAGAEHRRALERMRLIL